MLWKVLHFHWANVILAACFTLRDHGTHFDLPWSLFLVGGFALWCKSSFFDLFSSVKLFITVEGFNFLQKAFWSWITKRFSLVPECSVVSRWSQFVSFLISFPGCSIITDSDLQVQIWIVLLLPLCDQARPWFWFASRTSLVAGLASCLVACTIRITLVVLYRGENGTAVK